MRRKKLIIGDAIVHKSKVERLNYKNNRSLTREVCTNGSSRNTLLNAFRLSKIVLLLLPLLLTHYEGCPPLAACSLLPQSTAKIQNANTILSSLVFPSLLFTPANFHHLSLSETSSNPLLVNVFRSHQSQHVIFPSSISPHFLSQFFTLENFFLPFLSNTLICNLPLSLSFSNSTRIENFLAAELRDCHFEMEV